MQYLLQLQQQQTQPQGKHLNNCGSQIMEEHNTISPPTLGFIDDSNVSVDDSHITNDEGDKENSLISKSKEILQTIKNNNKSKNIILK